MPYWSTWYEMRCGKCNAHNFVNGGDQSDLTGFDPVAVKCWKCGAIESMDEDCGDEFEPEDAEDGVHFERMQPQKETA